jgi:hypothetical protein
MAPYASAKADVTAKLVAPGPDRLVCHVHVALGHQLLDIAIADRELEIQPYAMTDDLGRKPVATLRRARAVYRPISPEPAATDRAGGNPRSWRNRSK